MAQRTSAKALELIKEFEGLELTAYPDPGTGGDPWTIGYGHTAGVRPGDVITEQRAEELLREDLAHFEAGVSQLLPKVGDPVFSALVSFAFNVGLGALKTSTLRRRLLTGESTEKVLKEELPRWVKGGDGRPMPGLVRRREAEIALALSAPPASASDSPGGAVEGGTSQTPAERPPGPSEIDLEAFFRHYEHLPHQEQAVRLLAEALSGHPVLLDDHPWVKAYRSGPKEEIKQPPAPVSGSFVQIQAPYLYQLDSGTSHGPRMCFSSTNAMLVETLHPGVLKGAQEDDAYLHRVFKYGDTTSAEAQVQALRSYGVDATFRTDGTSRLAKEKLRAGIPVPIGVLHHGPASAPSGGGHWLLLVGFDEEKQQWICHDPYGEMNVSGGGYVSNAPTAGRFVRYSFRNLNRRWMVHGEGDGWFIDARR